MSDQQLTPVTRDDLLRLIAIAGVVVAVLLLVAGRYGYHRDELYFVAATEHMAWGYVDQPPLTIWVAWLAGAVAPGSLVVLRLLPALAIGSVVVLSGLIARRLGGGRRSMLMGAGAVAAAGIFAAVGHLLSTTTFDILFWAVILYLLLLILDSSDPRLWLVLGGVAGVGLLNKHLVLFLLFALFVGLLATPQRSVFRTRWPWLGGLVALAIWSPNLLWQIQNDWPTIEMLGSLQEGNSGLGSAIEFVGLQIPFLSIVLVPIALIGLRRLFSVAQGRYRAVAIAFLVLVVLFLVAGGKGYYVVPFYVVLLPMGMVEMEQRWLAGTARISRRSTIAAMVIAAVAMSPFFLPVVPPDSVGFFNAINKELGETIGWEEFVDQVSGVYNGFSAEQQGTAAIFTSSYGEAGAIDLHGPDLGLPPASSGHNAYWMWGPPADGSEPVIFVGYGPTLLNRYCESWDPAGTIDNDSGIENEEWGLPISVCHRLAAPWSALWPELRHYN